MLSNHGMSIRRISWSLALMTVAGLALTASGGRAAQQVAAITEQVETANFARLSDLVAQPGYADELATGQKGQKAEMAASSSGSRSPMQADHAPLPTPTVPLAPPAPATDNMPPPPAAPPAVGASDGGMAAIPGEADIRRRIPNVDVGSGCEEGRTVSHSETVDPDGSRRVRVRICEDAIKAQASSAARAGLIKARAEIARAMKISDEIRAEVLRDLNEQIARIDNRAAD